MTRPADAQAGHSSSYALLVVGVVVADWRMAVLLLRVAGAPDQPPREYLERMFTDAGRGSGNLVDYFDDVSLGQVDLGRSRLFGWMDYGHTKQELADAYRSAYDGKHDELIAAGMSVPAADKGAGDYANEVYRGLIVQWARDAFVAWNAGQDAPASLNDFGDRLICVFNQPIDYFGNPGRTVVNWDPAGPPFSVDLTGVAHEVGHNLGLNHSRLDGSNLEYGDPWDVMSAYDGVHLSTAGAAPGSSAPFLTAGPGLNAANMDLVGWLDPGRVLDLTGAGAGQIQLRPLHRRDLPGYLAVRFILDGRPHYAELRLTTRWDRAIPRPCVLLHRRGIHPAAGNWCSELLTFAVGGTGSARSDLVAGDSITVGDPTRIRAGAVDLAILDIDAQQERATLSFRVRPQRRDLQAGSPFAGVAAGAGGLVWTPGRGLHRVPPHSPVLSVLDALAEYEALQDVTGDGAADLERIRLGRLLQSRDRLDAIVRARQSYQVPAPPTDRSG